MTQSIYVLVDPNTLDVRYVGVTKKDPAKRYREHLSEARRGHSCYKCNWVRALSDSGKTPCLAIVARVSDDLRDYAESRYIDAFRNVGSPLTNIAPGGGGYWSATDDFREMCRQRQTGKRHSEATIAKMRESHMGQDMSAARAASPANKPGGKLSPEHIAKLKAVKRPTGWKHSEETKAKIRAARRRNTP